MYCGFGTFGLGRSGVASGLPANFNLIRSKRFLTGEKPTPTVAWLLAPGSHVPTRGLAEVLRDGQGTEIQLHTIHLGDCQRRRGALQPAWLLHVSLLLNPRNTRCILHQFIGIFISYACVPYWGWEVLTDRVRILFPCHRLVG